MNHAMYFISIPRLLPLEKGYFPWGEPYFPPREKTAAAAGELAFFCPSPSCIFLKIALQ